MRIHFKKPVQTLALILTVTTAWLPGKANAQIYPIDCAILLCLSGGWPASAPCARARAEFIRRITPWPVEPPLQIWRCPMGASYEIESQSYGAGRVHEASFHNLNLRRPQSYPSGGPSLEVAASESAWSLHATNAVVDLEDYALQLVQDRADIDISGPQFNFVRSIRVFDVRYARQRESGRDGDCNRSANVVLGTYGVQGDFSWQRSSTSALPAAHVGLERWGQHCPNIYHRSVFVDWRDYEGNYGFEQGDY